MSTDTRSANRERHRADARREVWLFGYGSLIWKADFPVLDRRPAAIEGWQRRFWQASHDHRGTVASPGRVVTLARAPGALCAGMAYLVTQDVFVHLDHREKNGYLRLATEIRFDDGGRAAGLVYIATPDNAAWLGPAPDEAIARQIAGAAGPSGRNRDYLFELARALRALGHEDAHVFAIERHLRRIEASPDAAA
ncbi:MAG: gamma-glutamylcyclotransferase [Burkholderiaceae bacterium]